MEDDRDAAKRGIDALKVKLLALTPRTGKTPTAVEGVYLYRMHEDERIDCFNEPRIGVIVQGDKRARTGNTALGRGGI